jgi:hypothetical protein
MLITYLESAREVLELEEVQFTGNSAYDDNGRFYVNNPSKIDYVSDPSPEIDEAWHNLTGRRLSSHKLSPHCIVDIIIL